MAIAPFSLGVTDPKTPVLPGQPDTRIPTKPTQTGEAPSPWDGSYWDPSKLQAALAAQQVGPDGRRVANDQTLMSALNPLSGITVKTPAQAGQMGFYGNEGKEGAYTMGDPTKAIYTDPQGRTYNDAGKDAQGNQLIQYTDNSGGGWQNPTSGGHDRVQPTYRLDAQGNAIPVSAGSSYKPSDWVSSGRDSAIALGTVLSAGAAGATLAGAGGAFDLGAGAAATGGAGGGLEGEAALAGGEGVAGGAATSAPAYGGVGTAGAGAGTDTIIGAGGLAEAAPVAAGGAGTAAAAGTGGAGAASSLIPGVSNQSLLTLGGTAALQAANRPPSPPDAGALIGQQSAANINAAETSAAINRPDVKTPFGNQTWTRVADPSQPGGYRYTQTNTLSPQEQALYDADTSNKIAKQGIATGLQGAAASAVSKPFSLAGEPAAVTSVANGADYAAQRQQVSDSIFNQGKRLLQPGMDQAQEAQDSQLRNQGLLPGTQAYDQALQKLRQSQDLQLSDLSDRAIQQGGAEQSRLAGLDLTSANFANNARQQATQENLLGRTQPLAELNSFQSGNAPTTPTFQPFGMSNVQPTNTIGAAQAQQSGETASYNARQAQLQSLLNLGTTLYGSKQPQYDPTTGTWVTPP